mmetsp:Transcript_9937/g.37043  ORF Transcript_9937/g.37043 Transcript_9937/m.37043 type:complete len:93 (+) Transcript_9937:529-807(+)
MFQQTSLRIAHLGDRTVAHFANSHNHALDGLSFGSPPALLLHTKTLLTVSPPKKWSATVQLGLAILNSTISLLSRTSRQNGDLGILIPPQNK